MKTPSNLYVDSPAWPLLQAGIAFWGVTTADGVAGGTTLVCASLVNEPTYLNMTAKILSGPAAGSERTIILNVAGTETVDSAFTNAAGAAQQITAGTLFVIVSNSAAIGQILALVKSIAGGAYWEPFGPGNVQVANAVTTGVTIFDPGGGIIPLANITAGTYNIDRIRGAVLTNIVVGAASSKTNGAVYDSYAYPGASWAIGDMAVHTFQGISIVIAGITTNLPDIQYWSRVVMEPDIDAIVTTINTNQGNPSADTLISTTAKIGNLARSLTTILGARWNAAGDISTDILALLNANIAIAGTVVDGAPAVTDFDTSLTEVTNNHYNGGLLIFLDGPNARQSHLIDVYTGANGNCAFAASDQWTDVPVNGNSFLILPSVGTYLKKIFTAIGALPGDPWLTALPGAYAGGTAGKIVGTNLDTTVSSRAPSATALTNVTWTDALATALGAYTAAKAAFLDIAISSRAATGESAAALIATAYTRSVGVTQIFTKNITSAANANDVTVATITAQPCLIKSVVLRSNGATTADLTNAAIYGGAIKVVTFIDSVSGVRANIAAADQQVYWIGAATFAATKTIVITLTGTGATAVNLQVDVEYEAIVSGGYLA